MNVRLAILAGCLVLAPAFAAGPEAQCAAPPPDSAPVQNISAKGLRVGLALGSGSAHGLAHIGVIEELEARGLEVRVVTGTSVGALIGGLWASGVKGREIENLFHASHWEDIGRLSGSWQGLLSNSSLREQLTPLFKGRAIESWPRRFGAVATNLDNGQRRILMSGDGALALQASSAVPVLYMPVTVAGEKLADGALVEPIPVAAARALGADYVIAVDIAYRPYEAGADGAVQYAFQAMHILINSLAAEQLARADVVIRLDLHSRFMSCGSKAVIAAGREAVRRAWPEIARSLQTRVAARDLKKGNKP
jgi:NTE family protein